MQKALFPGYTVGPDAYEDIVNICSAYGKKAAIIGGRKALAAAEPQIRKAVEGSGIEIIGTFWYGGEASRENMDMLRPQVADADMIFAVGGGVQNPHWMQIVADVTGKDAEKLLESVGLTVNKNSIPNEPRSPFVTSGIRVGSAAATTRGFTADDFYEVGQLIAATVFNAESEAKLADIRAKVDALLAAHPLYPELDY